MRTFFPLFLLLACGPKTKEIDDPQMQAQGVALGQQTSTLAEMNAEAPDSEVQGNTQSLGGTLQSLVSQHQALASSQARVAPRSSQARQTTDAAPISWDGTELCMNIDLDSAGVSIRYDVVFDLTTSGSDQVINGTYDLVYSIDLGLGSYDYDVSAVYDNVTTSGGCAVSGSVTIDYDYSLDGGLGGLAGGVGNTNDSGRVVIDYNGCDDVTISG